MNTKLLRQKILDLAIRGKLTEQKKSDGTTKDLLASIAASSACHAELVSASPSSSAKKNSKATERSVILSKRSASKDLAKEIIPLNKDEAPFEIPENWEWVRLGDLCEKITDGTHHSPINTETGDFMYVTAKNIKDEGVATEGITYVSAEVHEEIYARCAPEKGDVLLIKDGATTGVVTVNNIEEPFSLLSSVALLKPGKFFESWFLAFVIRSSLFNTMIRSQMKGVGITRVTLSQINSFELPLPPLAEQKRIVEAIESAFAEITEIENNQELLKKHIKQGRQKILDLAIRGKLTEQKKSDGTTKDLLTSIATASACHAELVSASPSSSAKKNSKATERSVILSKRSASKDLAKEIIPLNKDEAPFEIPETWEWVRLGDVCDKLIDGDHNPPKGISKQTEYLMLSSRNVNDNKVVDLENVRYLTKEMFEEENKRTNLIEGDILFTSVGSLGRSCVYDGNGNFCFQRSVTIVHTLIFNKYLKYFFDSDYYQKVIVENATGTAQLGFYLEQMRKSLVAIPPLAEQQRIVAAIESAFTEFDAMDKML